VSDAEKVWLVAGGEPGAVRFGQLVQRLRKEQQLSVERLAEDAALSVGTIRAIEQGRRAPSEESGVRLLKLLIPVGALEGKENTDPGQAHSDFTFVDPESGARVLLEFKAKTAGDNRRWSSDKPRPGESRIEATVREFMADGDRLNSFMTAIKPALTGMAVAVEGLKDLASRPASDAAFGRVVRRLAAVDEIRIAYLENLLWLWEEAAREDADASVRDVVSQIEKLINSIQPFPDEVIDLSAEEPTRRE
jgi:transcriptional regulator with XRE-family HTH domain